MIISHRYHFIFIKTHKTAGTSIEAFLSRVCGEEDIFTPLDPPLAGHQPRNYRGLFNPFQDFEVAETWLDGVRSLKHFLWGERFYNHMSARLVQRRLPPSLFENYYKFCVERNPWEKTLSYYHMANHRAGGGLTLDAFMRKGRFPVDHPLYVDSSGQLLVDRVIRYERLDEELNEVFARLGIPFSGSLGIQAKGDYRKDRRPYQEVFTKEQRQIIADAFAWEIEAFGYRF